MMDDLSFDLVKIDTSLAKEYIQNTYKNLIVGLGTAWDYEKKKIIKIGSIGCPAVINTSGLNKKLRNLSKKIQENSELFCQLEYLLRKTDVDETRNCHLELITKYLRLEEWMFDYEHNVVVLSLKETTPLYYLGHVATVLRLERRPQLVCDKTTAPICQLFYELCLDVGLPVSLYYVNNNQEFDSINRDRQLSIPPMSCTLAITEEADVDSAVDVFLNSSAQAPWSIDRVYAEESVYDQLLEALEVRCERVAGERGVATFRTRRGRTLQCGLGGGEGAGVPVRAYRGTRELLALLPSGGCLSLWCGEAAAAHELAHAADADVIWIDCYALFAGPLSITLPVYNYSKQGSRYVPESVYNLLLDTQLKWITLAPDERKAVILDALEMVSSTDPKFPKLAGEITAWTWLSDQVEVAIDRITMVVDRPDIYRELSPIYNCTIYETYLLETLKLLIRGYGCVLHCMEELKFYSVLCDAGVPVVIMENSFIKCPEYTHEMRCKRYKSHKKVIHSRCGTIYTK